MIMDRFRSAVGTSMKINLVARDNGAGISRDVDLLESTLNTLGHQVSVTRLSHYGTGTLQRLLQRVRTWHNRLVGARYDVNLLLEQLRPEVFPLARRNLLVPNPEWTREEWLPRLSELDGILAKTRHAERIFSGLGTPVHFIGFTSTDCRLADAEHKHDFFHCPGRSGNKGTARLLALWHRHPEWPLLTVLWRRAGAPDMASATNVRMIRERVGERELQQLQNASLFHLAPSSTEGFGHSIVESMSTGAVVITTDAEPMNELVMPGRGLLVAAHPAGRQHLATLYDFDDDAMEAAIRRCIDMSDAECQEIGGRARQWFEESRDAFAQRLATVLASLQLSAPA